MTRSWFTPLDTPDRQGMSMTSWKRVLVPLDGTALSTEVLAGARTLLEHPGISMTLLRVIECKKERANDLGYQLDPRHREAGDALAEIQSKFLDGSASVSAELRFGDPATEILRELAEGNHDLLIMSTYGRTARGRSLFGSVARRVLHSSPAPLLLFRPRMRSDEDLSSPGPSEVNRFERLLVALDGSKTAEEIVPTAEKMARTLGSELHLFRAVPGGRKEASERRSAEEYLRKWESSLASRGIPSQLNVRTGNAAESILALIRERRLDSVALTTHARTGLARAVYGSVTEELMRWAGVPILTLCNVGRRLPLPASSLEHRHMRVESP